MQQEPNHWHLSKTVNLGHLIATSLFVLGGLSAYYGVTERLALLEREFINLSSRMVSVLENQERTDSIQDRDLVSFRNEVRSDIRQINAKLDRLIETLVDNRSN